MQNTDINTMTPDELRTNLIDVCHVRDTLYAALDGKAHELAQRDARIAELEAELGRVRDMCVAMKYKLWEVDPISPLPFEQVPAPVNPDAPADLSMRGGIEAFTEECAHHALTGE